MQIHPSYDPIASIWYTDDGLEAKSLRQLQTMLPEGTEIVGYFPNGYGDVKLFAPRAAHLVKMSLQGAQQVRLTRVLTYKERVTTSQQVQQIDWSVSSNVETLRTLAAAKFTAAQIAVKMNTTRGSIVSACHRKDIKLLNGHQNQHRGPGLPMT